MIRDAREVGGPHRLLIRSIVKSRRSNMEGAVPISDELAKLAELRRDGTLSDDEFERAKERLLGQTPYDSSDVRRLPQQDAGEQRTRFVLGAVFGLVTTLGLAFF